jgi:hypothetical protein
VVQLGSQCNMVGLSMMRELAGLPSCSEGVSLSSLLSSSMSFCLEGVQSSLLSSSMSLCLEGVSSSAMLFSSMSLCLGGVPSSLFFLSMSLCLEGVSSSSLLSSSMSLCLEDVQSSLLSSSRLSALDVVEIKLLSSSMSLCLEGVSSSAMLFSSMSLCLEGVPSSSLSSSLVPFCLKGVTSSLLMSSIPTTSFFDTCMRIGEASNPGPGEKYMRIMTANVPGLRNHIGNVVSKNWDIAAFQESGISQKNIGMIQSKCTDNGLKLLHGPIGDQAVGGVTCLSKTRKVKEWRKGEELFVKNNRWQVVEIHITRNKKLLLVNIYGHSGANDKEDVREVNEMLLREIFHMCSTYHKGVPIVGDLNTSWELSDTLIEQEKDGVV